MLFTVTSTVCLKISITSNSCNLLHISTVKLLNTEKEKGGKPDRKPYPLPYDLRNPYRNIKSNSQDCAQKPQRNCTFMKLPSLEMKKVTENFYSLLREKNKNKAVKFWFLYISAQCCGSEFFHPGSRAEKIPDPHQRI